MRLARLGPAGAEIPTVVVDGTHHDLRPLLDSLGVSDLGPAFFAADGLARTGAAVADGTLDVLASTTATTRRRPARRCRTSPSCS